MRAYKIILIVFLVILILGICVGTYGVYQDEKGDPVLIFMIIYMIIGGLLSFVSLWYHFKSFRNYRKSKPYKSENKLSLVLRACSVACGVYFILFAGLSLLGIVLDNSLAPIAFIVLMMIFLFGFFNIFEAILMRKTVRKLQKELEAKEDIDAIGN